MRHPGIWFCPSLILAIGLLLPAIGHAQHAARAVGPTNARTIPYRFAGRLLYSVGSAEHIATGVVYSARNVCTAAQNLYVRRTGFTTVSRFERGRYGGYVSKSVAPSSTLVLAGYTDEVDANGASTNAAFALDVGVVVCKVTLAAGSHVTYRDYPDFLREQGRYKEAVGYGTGNSERTLLYSGTSQRFDSINSAYFTCTGITIKEGMLGGPFFVETGAGSRMAGIVVFGNSKITGVRAIDAAAKKFFNENR